MAEKRRREMTLSPFWLQASIITFVVGFTILGILAYVIYRDQPPIPERVGGPAGEVLFTGDDIRKGQDVFQKYGLMQYGTLYGHGAYLGPDFTADYLHRQALLMLEVYRDDPAASERVRAEQVRYADEVALFTTTYLLDAGGKRLRPMLVLLTAQLGPDPVG